MAVLEQKQSAGFFPRTEPAPKGTYLAVCLDIRDQFGVQRPNFDDKTKMDTVDVTRFLFGLKAKDGKRYLIDSNEMKISANEKSSLIKFLTAWLGEAPKLGWDYCTLVNEPATVSVTHFESKRTPGKFFANISAISPVLEEIRGKAPKPADFADLLGGEAPKATSAPAKPEVQEPDDDENPY